MKNTTAVINHDGGIKNLDTERKVNKPDNPTSIIAYSERLNTKHALYLAAKTITLGNQQKTFIAAQYYRAPLIRDVSTTLIPNPRQDATKNALSILDHYAALFDNVDIICFSLDDLGFILSASNGVRVKKIVETENPATEPLNKKIAAVMEDLRNNRRI